LLALFGIYLSLALTNISANQGNRIYFAADPTTFTKFHSQSNSTGGLETSLSLNTTYLYPGQWISINISENNTRDSVTNITLSHDWPIKYHSLGPCSEFSSIGIAVFAGYYTQSNVTAAGASSLVSFINPGQIYNCPAIFSANSYSFEPLSNLVNISNACVGSNAPGCLIPMEGTVQLNGSWTRNGASATESALTPGIYTVVGSDEWGELVILHFAVTNVKIVSAVGPIPPYNPGGPVVSITLMNLGNIAITSLNASLRLESQISIATSYQFVFPVNQSAPLLPDQIVKDTQILLDAGFDNNQSYHLIVSGSFENGVDFTYIDLIVISPP
jgi:hypothetical protein